jgi:hypothetical protein
MIMNLSVFILLKVYVIINFRIYKISLPAIFNFPAG